MKQTKTSLRELLEEKPGTLNQKFETLYMQNYQKHNKEVSKRFQKDHYFYFSTSYFKFLQHRKLDLDIDWKHIQQITLQTLDTIICPICMSENEELVLPRILRCHHIYCLSCIIHHFIDVRQDCPICSEVLSIESFKRIKIKNYLPKVGEKMDFVLMQKYTRSFKIQICSDLNNEKENNFLNKIREFSKQQLENSLMQDLQTIHQNPHFVDLDEMIQKFTEFILLKELNNFLNVEEKIIVDNRIPNIKEKNMQKIPDIKKLLYFYQNSLGYNIFMDPLDFQFISESKENFQTLDFHLKNLEIKEIEKFTKNLEQLKKEQRFAHVGVNNVFYVVRVNLEPLLSKSNFANYNFQLKKRKNEEKEKQLEQEQIQRKPSLEEDYKMAKKIYEEEKMAWQDPEQEIYDQIEFDGNYDEHYPTLPEQMIKQFAPRFKNLMDINNKSIKEKMKQKPKKKIQEKTQKAEEEIEIKKKKKKRKKFQIQLQINIMESSNSLQNIFDSYGGKEMNGRTFVKVFKDAKVIGKDLTSNSLDIVFSKIKTKGQHKITFEQFTEGVKLAAEEKKCTFEQLSQKLQNLKKPEFHGTKAQHVKLHDDKTTYTGVYKEGGPQTVDKGKGKIADLSDMLQRKDADVRGVNKEIMDHNKK